MQKSLDQVNIPKVQSSSPRSHRRARREDRPFQNVQGQLQDVQKLDFLGQVSSLSLKPTPEGHRAVCCPRKPSDRGRKR